ncbi:MAG: AbrB/MazE/SpoVT family DNA-binding domain-containing protein [Bacillota bacterium]
MRNTRVKKTPRKRGLTKATSARWILKLNPKGQATIPLEVRKMLGADTECRELELLATENGFQLLPHKPPLPVRRYIGYCAEELEGMDDPVVFFRELRGRAADAAEE